MNPAPSKQIHASKPHCDSQDLLTVEFVLRPLQELGTAFWGVLETLANQLIGPGEPTLTLHFVLRSLAEIAPSRIHPSIIIPKVDSYLGSDIDRAAVIANQQASEQLLQEELDRQLKKFFALDPDPIQQPDTGGWASLFSHLAIKWQHGLLSPKERAAYESLSVFWYSATCFQSAPRIVPLAAKMKAGLSSEVCDEESLQFHQALANELRAYLVAPNDEAVREVLQRTNFQLGSLSKNEREMLNRNWENASIRTIDTDSCSSLDLSLKRFGASWPTPERDTLQSRLSCLHRRAILAVQMCEMSCEEMGCIEAISTERNLGALVNRTEAWVSILLNKSLPREVMERRNFGSLSHGRTSGDAAAAREARLVSLQQKLVAEYIKFLNTNDPNSFASDSSLAAECGFSVDRVQRYLRMIFEVPWFRAISLIRNRLAEACSLTPAPIAPIAETSRTSAATLTVMASGCRYRDEYFDSFMEATVAVLLEKYLLGFRILRHQTYQVAAGNKKIDFRLGEYDGKVHYIEYHPIILGRPCHIHDFRDDEEAQEYHTRFAKTPSNEQGRLAEEVTQELSRRYRESRAALVADREPGAILHHIRDERELYDVLKLLTDGTTLPSRSDFEREFSKLISALSALHYAEVLVDEHLQKEYGEYYNRDWRIAAPAQVSRPVRNHDQGDLSEKSNPPVITSFAHKSEPRVVEFFVPYLFDSTLQTGRVDDDLYRCENALTEGLAARGYSSLCLPASSVNEQSIIEIARQILEFLMTAPVQSKVQITADTESSDLLFRKRRWVKSF